MQVHQLIEILAKLDPKIEVVLEKDGAEEPLRSLTFLKMKRADRIALCSDSEERKAVLLN